MTPQPTTRSLVTASYYASFVAMGISMAVLGPTLPGLAEKTGSGLGAIGILFSARSLGSLLGSVGLGTIYDRLNGHHVMALMVVLMVLFTALTPFVPLLWLLALLLFLTGLVQGLLNIGGNALLVWLHGEKVGPYMNGMHLFFGIGTFLTPILVAQFIERQGGLVWTYLLMAVIMLPTAALALLPPPLSPQVTAGPQAGKLDVGLIVLISLVFACYNGASTAYGGWVYSYAVKMKMTDAVGAAYLTSVFWGGLSVGRIAAIPLAMRFSPRAILRADYIGALLSLLAILVWPNSMAALIFTSACFGFAVASIYPTTMSLSGQLMPITGKVTGLFSIGQSGGAMLLPWLIGQFFDSAGPQSMMLILAVDIVFALGVLAVLARRRMRTESASLI